MKESLKTKMMRLSFNFFPAYRRTGARIIFIEEHLNKISIKLSLNWKTKNYVGTIFGGCMFAAVDPIYLVALIKKLGSGFIVWDRKASIEFKKPAKSTLYADFLLSDDDVKSIREDLTRKKMIKREYVTELKDENDVVYAVVHKTIYINKVK